MPLLTIATTGVATPAARGGATLRAVAAGPVASSDRVPARVGATTLPGKGLRAWNTQLNRQVAHAQQALGFLDDAAGQLQDLRGELSKRVARRAPSGDSAALTDKLRRFDASWRARTLSTSGSLSPQLEFSSPHPALQHFTVGGLDLQSLQRGEPETLSFTVSTAPTSLQPLVVQLEPGLSGDVLARRFDRALAAANIRVQQGEAGKLRLSVPEVDWPAVRDSLAVKGGGMRFPTGQFNRLRSDALPDAVQPQHWTADGADAMRQTLRQVLQAIDTIRDAKATVGGELVRTGQWLAAAAPADPADWADWASVAAADFASVASQTSYDAFVSITAGLTGVNRGRVSSLLALR